MLSLSTLPSGSPSVIFLPFSSPLCELSLTWHFLQLVESHFNHVKSFSPLSRSHTVCLTPFPQSLAHCVKKNRRQSLFPITKGSMTLTLTVSKLMDIVQGWGVKVDETLRLLDWIIFNINTTHDNLLIPTSICLMWTSQLFITLNVNSTRSKRKDFCFACRWLCF